MREGTCEFLCVGQVDALVWGVGVGLGSDESESNDARVGEHLVELSKKRDGASHSVALALCTIIEVSAGLKDSILEPRLHLFHAPSLSVVVASQCYFGVVWDVFSEFFLQNLSHVICIGVWSKSHGNLDTCACSAHITTGSTRGYAISTCDRDVGAPGVVQVHLRQIVLLKALNALMDPILLVHGVAAHLSHCLCLLSGPVRNWCLEFVCADPSFVVIDAVEKFSNDSEGLWQNTTKLA